MALSDDDAAKLAKAIVDAQRGQEPTGIDAIALSGARGCIWFFVVCFVVLVLLAIFGSL